MSTSYLPVKCVKLRYSKYQKLASKYDPTQIPRLARICITRSTIQSKHNETIMPYISKQDLHAFTWSNAWICCIHKRRCISPITVRVSTNQSLETTLRPVHATHETTGSYGPSSPTSNAFPSIPRRRSRERMETSLRRRMTKEEVSSQHDVCCYDSWRVWNRQCPGWTSGTAPLAGGELWFFYNFFFFETNFIFGLKEWDWEWE